MILVVLLALGCAVFFNVEYYSDLKRIRSYLKSNDNELYKKYSLDLGSLMLGTEDVEWNAQKYILEKKYIGHSDDKLVEMCNKAYKSGFYTIISFVVLLALFIISGALSS
ncbi:hypothetical protein [Shewanella gelidii]|uniref:hypothetical protein n=1 Tax=Shewanella gelidii TaxID=1642821 RepID=UPI00200EEA0A|nr:hypothetical protein [Shewanella gelidii]MCL1098539.1 hypothetical protein [Shewanella gelidii]MCL1098551.1 hypothetical protein [Shewanella gelidii]